MNEVVHSANGTFSSGIFLQYAGSLVFSIDLKHRPVSKASSIDVKCCKLDPPTPLTFFRDDLWLRLPQLDLRKVGSKWA